MATGDRRAAPARRNIRRRTARACAGAETTREGGERARTQRRDVYCCLARRVVRVAHNYIIISLAKHLDT